MNTNYNGIITKVKAMDSKLLSDDDFNNILSTNSVPEAINYIKEHTSYKMFFSDEDISHRSQIEELLSLALYMDFMKLYHFAYSEQKKYLSFSFDYLELSMLKQCITDFSKHQKNGLKILNFPFIKEHTQIDFEKLYSATSLSEFISYLSNTKYYTTLKKLYDYRVTNYFEYINSLDLFYYTDLWKKKDKILTGQSLDSLTDIIGSEIDLLNIMWIFRCKKYYNVEPSIILNHYIIPINYKLKKQEMLSLINTESIHDFSKILSKTHYGKSHYKIDIDNIEYSYNQILLETHNACSRRYPDSMAPVHAYIFKRQNEIQRIINSIERIRYNVKR